MKQPWYWKERKAWFVDDDVDDDVDGRIRLGKSKSEAYEQWRKLRDQNDRRGEGDPTFSELAEAYCDFGLNQVRLRQIQRSTLDDYLSYSDWFSEEHGSMRISELAPRHVTDWLANHPSWGAVASGLRSRRLNGS